jgi:hypothetical protein
MLPKRANRLDVRNYLFTAEQEGGSTLNGAQKGLPYKTEPIVTVCTSQLYFDLHVTVPMSQLASHGTCGHQQLHMQRQRLPK